MPYADVNGLSLAYDREGSGPTLVMIHGASQDSRSWRFNVPFFANGTNFSRTPSMALTVKNGRCAQQDREDGE